MLGLTPVSGFSPGSRDAGLQERAGRGVVSIPARQGRSGELALGGYRPDPNGSAPRSHGPRITWARAQAPACSSDGRLGADPPPDESGADQRRCATSPSGSMSSPTGSITERVVSSGCGFGVLTEVRRVRVGESAEVRESPPARNLGQRRCCVGRVQFGADTFEPELTEVLHRGDTEVCSELVLEHVRADAGNLGDRSGGERRSWMRVDERGGSREACRYHCAVVGFCRSGGVVVLLHQARYCCTIGHANGSRAARPTRLRYCTTIA